MKIMKTPSRTAQNATRSGLRLICVVVRFGRLYGSGRPVICTVLRLTRFLLFRAPTGLAVGLALKELRYAGSPAIRPRPCGQFGSPAPRLPMAGPRLWTVRHGNNADRTVKLARRRRGHSCPATSLM